MQLAVVIVNSAAKCYQLICISRARRSNSTAIHLFAGEWGSTAEQAKKLGHTNYKHYDYDMMIVGSWSSYALSKIN